MKIYQLRGNATPDYSGSQKILIKTMIYKINEFEFSYYVKADFDEITHVGFIVFKKNMNHLAGTMIRKRSLCIRIPLIYNQRQKLVWPNESGKNCIMERTVCFRPNKLGSVHTAEMIKFQKKQ